MTQRPEQPVAPLLVSKRDAATMLGLSERMIDMLATAGELPRVRFGKARGVRFRVRDLERIIEDRTELARSDDRQARDRQGRFRKEG